MARKQTNRRRPGPARHYARTARLNALLREIVADYFERVDDDLIGLLTVTGVEVDADLNVAEVFVSSLTDADDDEVLDALAGHRRALQREIGSQAKLRKTPHVQFAFDPAVRAGARIEELLRSVTPTEESDGAGAAE